MTKAAFWGAWNWTAAASATELNACFSLTVIDVCFVPGGAGGQDLLVCLPGQVRAALAERFDGLHDPLGQELLLLVAADLRLPAEVPVVLPVIREEDLVEAVDVAAARMAGLALINALGVGDHAQNLFADHLRRVGHSHHVAERLRHLLASVVAEAARRLGGGALEFRKARLVNTIEAAGGLARHLDVRVLVASDRYEAALYEQDVRRLQHRVGEEPEVDVIRLLARLLLERRRALDPAVGSDHAEEQEKLGHLRHRRLQVKDAFGGVDADGKDVTGQVEEVVLEVPGVGSGPHAVIVRDHVEALVVAAVLKLHPVLGGSEVIPEMKAAGRPHATQNPPLGSHDRPSLPG